jgi:hypothetical protein
MTTTVVGCFQLRDQVIVRVRGLDPGAPLTIGDLLQIGDAVVRVERLAACAEDLDLLIASAPPALCASVSRVTHAPPC